MNVVCLTFKKVDITVETVRNFLDAVRDDGRVFFTPTVYNGTPAIRAAISNWLTQQQDVDVAFQVIESICHKQKKVTSI